MSKAVQTICSHGSKPSSNQDQSTGGARVAFVCGCINQFDTQIVCRSDKGRRWGIIARAEQCVSNLCARIKVQFISIVLFMLFLYKVAQSVQHPSCVSTRSRVWLFQREMLRGGLCAANLFPCFKSQRTSDFVGGWCSRFFCARLHQSVRHSRRTDSMSRRLAFQRGLLPRPLCEEHETIIEFSRRLASQFDTQVVYPPDHGVGTLMRTIAPKALCAIFSHVPLAHFTKSSFDGCCLCLSLVHRPPISSTSISFKHTNKPSYKQSNVWSSNPVKSIGGVRVSIRNIANNQFGIRIFFFTNTTYDDVTPCAACCMGNVFSRARTQLLLSPLDG